MGVEGQQASIPCHSIDVAISSFSRKLREKISGGYREVEMNYDSDDKTEEKTELKGNGDKKKEEQP